MPPPGCILFEGDSFNFLLTRNMNQKVIFILVYSSRLSWGESLSIYTIRKASGRYWLGGSPCHQVNAILSSSGSNEVHKEDQRRIRTLHINLVHTLHFLELKKGETQALAQKIHSRIHVWRNNFKYHLYIFEWKSLQHSLHGNHSRSRTVSHLDVQNESPICWCSLKDINSCGKNDRYVVTK